MLRRIGRSVIEAGDTTSPALFPAKLEFNPPVHEPWNIVHIGMLVPEAHQVYVCAVNCMRGVVLTAAEMGARERFSCVVLKEEDITRGTVEEVTLEGITDAMRKLETRGSLPPCVIVFPVCTHHFLGVSMAHVYRDLEERFPTVDFIHGFMDPIMNSRLTPDVRLRDVMHDVLRPCDEDNRLVAHLGSDFPLDGDCDLRQMVSASRRSLASIHDCASYADYQGLARAGLLVATYPNARRGLEKVAARLGRRALYLPGSFSYDEIEAQRAELAEALGIQVPDTAAEIAACDEELARTKALVGDTPIAIDAALHPRPLGLARLLLEHGLNVQEVYLDVVSAEDADSLVWLKEHAPHVQLSSIVLPELRVATRTRARTMLALGPKAAWFTGTDRFVNIVEGGGLWGFAGIRTLARLMREAWESPKDTRSIVPRKGLGCVSCI